MRPWTDQLDDNRKRLYLDLRLKQGKSQEEAFLIMADVWAEAKLEEKMRQTRIEAARMQKAGELAQRNAEKMQMTTWRVHWKSETARRQREAAALEKLRAVPSEILNPVSNAQALEDFLSWKPEPFREN